MVAYASMSNHNPEHNLAPRIKVTLTRTGKLDCRGNYLQQNNFKTANVEKIHLVQAIIRMPAHFVVKFKSNFNHDKLRKIELFFIEG